MNQKERWQISQISHGKNGEFHSLKWIHVIGWNSTKWLRALSDRSNKHVRLSHHTAADCLWLQLSHRSSPSASSVWSWVAAGGDNHKQDPTDVCWTFLFLWGTTMASWSCHVGRCSAGTGATTETLELWQQDQQDLIFTAQPHWWKAEREDSRKKIGTRGDTVAAHSLPCWGWPSRSDSAICRATRCWHMQPHSNPTTACIPNRKQTLSSLFPFSVFSGDQNQCHKPLSQVVLHDFCWQNVVIAVTAHFEGNVC